MEAADFVKAFPGSASSREPGWLAQSRRLAMERFERLGFPTTADEEWKYTNVDPIRKIPISSEPSRDVIVPLSPSDHRIVFVDGRFSATDSKVGALPDGAFLGSIASILENPSPETSRLEEHITRHAHFDGNAFTALNTAFFSDGAFLHLPKNSTIEHPVEIVHVQSAGARVVHPRNLIIVGDFAKVTIIERYISLAPEGSPNFANAVTEIVGGKESRVDHYKLQTNEPNAYHIAASQIVLDRAANFRTHSIVMGSRFSRNTIGATLNDEGIECTLNGLYVATADQHVDNHTAIDHAKPHCNSHELYKGILDDDARAVFNGKVFVRKDAQKTDAKQTNRNLILSDRAIVDTKPQLEIFADDVKCTHGATIGQLDDEALFYLRSRGVGEERARSLLTYGFAIDILQRIDVEPLRAELDALLLERLHTRFGESPEHG